MPTPTATPVVLTPPELRDGERYAGLATSIDGKAVHHLVLLPGAEKLPWQKARDWAAQQGGTLPSRHDGLVLLKHAKAHFERDWYWTDEQHAVDPQYAWIQSFDWGSQFFDHVDNDCRCRAVRRVPIR